MHNGILLILMLLDANAQPDWRADLGSVQRAAAKLQTLEAHFVQRKELEILAKPLESKGRLYFRAPDSLRWEYVYPVQSILIVNQGQVSRYIRYRGAYVPDAAERIEALRVVVSEIQGWLAGQFDQSSVFQASLDSKHSVVLQSKNQSLAKFIQRITLKLDKRPGVISSIRIEEDQRNQTRIDFFDVKCNQPIDEALFQPPE